MKKSCGGAGLQRVASEKFKEVVKWRRMGQVHYLVCPPRNRKRTIKNESNKKDDKSIDQARVHARRATPKTLFNRLKTMYKDKPDIDFNWVSQFRAIAELNAFAEELSVHPTNGLLRYIDDILEKAPTIISQPTYKEL
ncbi:unnamed protein product [Nezara viridula]|uniref:Uncharacterized protein n=1 Tax=Nezara viridula TaxID=85310 RepID=A0A9P0HTE0_NEZVI|nr:unnamed protein product [Nezara viridula]